MGFSLGVLYAVADGGWGWCHLKVQMNSVSTVTPSTSLATDAGCQLEVPSGMPAHDLSMWLRLPRAWQLDSERERVSL